MSCRTIYSRWGSHLCYAKRPSFEGSPCDGFHSRPRPVPVRNILFRVHPTFMEVDKEIEYDQDYDFEVLILAGMGYLELY